MINREDSALIAREQRNRVPAKSLAAGRANSANRSKPAGIKPPRINQATEAKRAAEHYSR